LRPPLTLNDYIQLDEHIASFNRISPHREILEKAVSLVKNPKDFLRLLEFRSKDPSDLYKKLIDIFIAKHVQILGRLTTKITSKQFDQLFKKAESVVAVAAIHRLAVSVSKTPSELFQALEYSVKNPTAEYKKEMEAIVSEALDPLMKLSPSVDDIVKFRKTYVQTKGLDTEAIRRGMASVKSARDYFKLIEPTYQETAQDLQKYRGKAIYDTFPRLLEKTQLTQKEYESLLSLSPGIQEFHDKAIKAQSAFSCVFQRMREWSVRR
jgi:hypothetical protein